MGSVGALPPSEGVSWLPHLIDDDVPVRESLDWRRSSATEEALTRSRATLVNCRDLFVCKYSASYGAVYNQWTI
jgi:hypothetical protein